MTKFYTRFVTSFKKFFSGLTASSFILSAISFCADVSTEMLYPVLPIFLTGVLGTSPAIVGLIEGIAVGSQNITQGFSGYLSDKLQKRKPIALFGYTLAALSKPFIGVASFWQEVFLARFLDRTGVGFRSAPRDALIAGSTDEAHRGKAFGIEGFGDNLGAFVGPIITIILLYAVKVPIRWIFYLTIIPGLLAAILLLFVKERKLEIASKIKLDLSFRRFPASYWKYLIVTAIFGLGNFSTAFLILRTRQIGTPLIVTIFIYSLFNLIAALISYPAGTISDKLGRKTVLFSAFCIFILTFFGFAVSNNFFLLSFLFVLYGLFSGIYRSIGKAFAVDLAPSNLRASAVGYYASVVGLTTLLSSSIAGLIWTLISPTTAFLFGVTCAVIGAISLIAFFITL